MSAPTCPKCAQVMTGGQLGPIRLSLCLPCRGVWLGAAELQQLIKAGSVVIRRLGGRLAAGGAIAANTGRTGFTCPHCAVPLASTQSPTLPGVRTDYCRFCMNYWIEAPALEGIAVLMEPRPTPPPPAPAPPTPPPVHAPATLHFTPPGAYAHAAPVAVPPPFPPPAVPAPPTSAPQAGSPKLPKVSAVERQICPSCGESNTLSAAVCWACGKGFIGRVIGVCPRCEGQLREVESTGVTIGACDGCNGVWAEEGKLVALLRQPVAAREQVIRQVQRTRTGKIRKLNEGLVCRTCDLILLRAPMMVSSEPVDTCPGCSGTFMEEGVLPLMLRSGEVW